jgi:hypothetical protein
MLMAGLGPASPASAATITVANTNDAGAGSLRQAIADAAAGDTIALGVSGTITLTTGELVIGKDLTIAGPGASQLTISGNAASRVFFINPGAPGATTGPPATTPIVNIAGLTLANGKAKGGNGATGSAGGGAGMGGALFVNGGNATLSQVSFAGNQAIGGNGSGFGGNGGGGGAGGDAPTSGYDNGGPGGSLGGFGGLDGDQLPGCIAAPGGDGGGGRGGDCALAWAIHGPCSSGPQGWWLETRQAYGRHEGPRYRK